MHAPRRRTDLRARREPRGRRGGTARFQKFVRRRSCHAAYCFDAWGGRRGPIGRFHSNQLLSLSHMFEAMSSVSEDAGRMPSGPRSETEVALNFARAKGCVPIPGVNTGVQAREVVAAFDWDLDLAQVEALSEQAVLLHARRRELSWLKNV